jgi:LemA protein
MGITSIIVLVVLALIIIGGIGYYNKFIRLRTRADEAWSDIDVQLKRRYDLIPNLIETVKGYAAHESQTFQNVTEARTKAMEAQSAKEPVKVDF